MSQDQRRFEALVDRVAARVTSPTHEIRFVHFLGRPAVFYWNTSGMESLINLVRPTELGHGGDGWQEAEDRIVRDLLARAG